MPGTIPSFKIDLFHSIYYILLIMDIKLTIGAWQNKVPGTVGIGLEPGPACDRFIDARYLDLFFKENSVSEIFTFDMIEHIRTNEIIPTLKSWYKILKKKGRLEIGTVDLECICKEFILADLSKRKILINHFYGSQSFHSDVHQTGFTFEILKEYLEKSNFVSIKKIDSLYKSWCGSLILEAFK